MTEFRDWDLFDLLKSCGWPRELIHEAAVIATCESGEPWQLRTHLKEMTESGYIPFAQAVDELKELNVGIINANTDKFNPNDPYEGSAGMFQINGYWRFKGDIDTTFNGGKFRWNLRFSPRYNARYALKLVERYGWWPWSTSTILPELPCEGGNCTERLSTGTTRYPGHIKYKTHSQRYIKRLPPPDERMICNDCLKAKAY